ncbi:CLUMA_CG017507, isoform A [Clunio marinus]|uniref:3-phosphoinositide-dependent protein kinase 1 n=1 Tax=Clunio marinus TaxID=568069 RepID=A0A1J1IW34_9DIPT|nr:CLUMA_CG017507, isoform A [Clunio marinus]
MENTRSRKSPEDFQFGRVIGEGSFSTVYLAKEVESGKEFAIKVCDKDHIIREKKQEYIKREKSALHLLSNSQGIIRLAYTFQDRSKLYFVLTYAPNGELLKYINKLGSLSIECVRFYSAELLRAIEEMHKKNIIHRDLKPENLLLNRDMHLLLADFGSSKILPEDYDYDIAQDEIERNREEKANESDDSNDIRLRNSRLVRRVSFVGTAQYVSPEVLNGDAPHLSTDLWAFGCIIYQMISGVPPFRGASDYLIFQKIKNLDFKFSDDFEEQAKDLITKLLRIRPKERLGANDSDEIRYHSIRSHPFFEGIVWNDIYKQKPPEIKIPPNINDDDLQQSDFEFSDEIEPGLGQRQLRRILQMEFGSAKISSAKEQNSTPPPSSTSLLQKLLEEQKQLEWSAFVESDELILRYGFIMKRKKGLFARRRMLLLTNKPRLIYIDPNTNIKKGEIPFDANISCEAKNFRHFLVHTPNRIYYLEDLKGDALIWCEAIENARQKYIKVS